MLMLFISLTYVSCTESDKQNIRRKIDEYKREQNKLAEVVVDQQKTIDELKAQQRKFTFRYQVANTSCRYLEVIGEHFDVDQQKISQFESKKKESEADEGRLKIQIALEENKLRETRMRMYKISNDISKEKMKLQF